MRKPRLCPALAVLALSAALAAPLSAAEFDDPDWPCIQRKVPSLSIGQMWSGPLPEGAWRDTPEIAALASRLAPRRTSIEQVETEVADFAAGLPEPERAEALAELFAGVLETIDAERAELIAGIGRYAQNQTGLSTRIETMQGELLTLAAAEDENLDRVEELKDTIAWEARIFRDRAQALTYVCETPVLLEQRAFAIARLIAERI